MTISATPEQTMHTRLPSGFTYADQLQEAAFEATGSVDGASKVAQVATPEGVRLAVRLRPPRTLDNVKSNIGRRAVTSVQEYIDEYLEGWREASLGGDMTGGGGAWEDGFLDNAAGRMKWHLTYCTDHDNCGEA